MQTARDFTIWYTSVNIVNQSQSLSTIPQCDDQGDYVDTCGLVLRVVSILASCARQRLTLFRRAAERLPRDRHAGRRWLQQQPADGAIVGSVARRRIQSTSRAAERTADFCRCRARRPMTPHAALAASARLAAPTVRPSPAEANRVYVAVTRMGGLSDRHGFTQTLPRLRCSCCGCFYTAAVDSCGCRISAVPCANTLSPRAADVESRGVKSCPLLFRTAPQPYT